MTVEIVNQQNAMKVPRGKIRTLLRHVMKEELAREVNVSVAVVTDRRIAELNEAYLGHAGPTDVLAFPFGEEENGTERTAVFGEIVISADRALAEAERRNVGPEDELLLYVVHGMLHLMGYDDGSIAERRAMRRREAAVLRRLSTKNGKEP